MTTMTTSTQSKTTTLPCLICETKNQMDSLVCSACGAPMALIQEAVLQERDPCIVTVLGDSNVGKTVYLGAHATEEGAANAYKAAAERHAKGWQPPVKKRRFCEDYAKAQAIARSDAYKGPKTAVGWRAFARNHANLPADPRRKYKKTGWMTWAVFFNK